MCQYGFSPTANEVIDLVVDFMKMNALDISYFKSGRPGRDWLNAFMKRQKLSMKNAEMICASRKNATENPWIIYDFYESIDNIIKTQNLTAKQIWNCDESGFPTDPSKCKCIAVKGEKAYKVTLGPGRENISTMATCSAGGEVLDPLLIFAGKNLQNTWKGDKALKNTWYAVSDNGWMTKEVFRDWFKKFVRHVKIRPLLLILDGHLTHTSLDVILLAREEKITIVKLPAHTTDLLQPLDVTCFGPLKRKWQEKLNQWVSLFGSNQKLTKAQFDNLLSEVWHEGISAKNVKAGFERTGIFPTDKEKYPDRRFNPQLLDRYQRWDKAGRPESMKDVGTPKKIVSPRKTTTPSRQGNKSKSSASITCGGSHECCKLISQENQIASHKACYE